MIIPANPGYTVWEYELSPESKDAYFRKLGDVVAWDIETDIRDSACGVEPQPIIDAFEPHQIKDITRTTRRPDGTWFVKSKSFDNEVQLRKHLAKIILTN